MPLASGPWLACPAWSPDGRRVAFQQRSGERVAIFVMDANGTGLTCLSDPHAGGWDWSKGEPPKTNPAYYLRFCKSFSRMGGPLHYAQSDNVAFLHHLYRELGRA